VGSEFDSVDDMDTCSNLVEVAQWPS
jgi:hypothetical protein